MFATLFRVKNKILFLKTPIAVEHVGFDCLAAAAVDADYPEPIDRLAVHPVAAVVVEMTGDPLKSKELLAVHAAGDSVAVNADHSELIGRFVLRAAAADFVAMAVDLLEPNELRAAAFSLAIEAAGAAAVAVDVDQPEWIDRLAVAGFHVAAAAAVALTVNHLETIDLLAAELAAAVAISAGYPELTDGEAAVDRAAAVTMIVRAASSVVQCHYRVAASAPRIFADDLAGAVYGAASEAVARAAARAFDATANPAPFSLPNHIESRALYITFTTIKRTLHYFHYNYTRTKL